MAKIIISDTSSLIALQNIELLYLLKDLYQEILITKEVKNEFGLDLPDWIIVLEVTDINKQAEIEKNWIKAKQAQLLWLWKLIIRCSSSMN